MKTQVEFRSSKFPPYEGEQEQINPGLWGKRLAEYLVQCDAHPNGVAAMTWQRCANYYFMQFNSWEYMYYQNRDRSIPNSFGSEQTPTSRHSYKQSQATGAFGMKWRRPSTNPSDLTPRKSFDEEQRSRPASPD